MSTFHAPSPIRRQGPDTPTHAGAGAVSAWGGGVAAVVAIGAGASIGALLRWQLGVWLNHLHTGVPPGTLVANVVGGYLVGLAVAYFAHQPGLSPEWRLFVITGFLGGLTTFSTFSAEVVALLQQGRVLMAGAAIGAHLAGSLLATLAGIASVEIARKAL
ncbi:MAG TPA: fluoride efflux transporter CrcB [Rubrivivax sp.]